MNPNAWLDQMAPRLNVLWRGFWKAGTVEPGRYLYDHELVIVTKGSCRVQVGRVFHELVPGSWLIVSPGVYHVTTTNPGGVHRSCFHFDWATPSRKLLPLLVYHPAQPKRAQLKRAPAFVPHRRWVGQFDLEGSVPSLVETIFHRWQTGSGQDRATCHVVLAELLIGLLWRKGAERSPQGQANRLAYAVKELLDRTPGGSEGIQPLLTTLGFSYAHLCRLFKAAFGVSPVEYRNAARLERAKNLLRDPKRTIAEAAYAAGFNDPAYFSRKFHQRHGMPPSRARR
jgi:AraC-like DNA-binding protein